MMTSWATFWLSVRELIQRRTAGLSAGLTAFFAAAVFVGFLAAGRTAPGIKGAEARAVTATARIRSFRTSDGFGLHLRASAFLRRRRSLGSCPGQQAVHGTQQVGNFV